MEPEALYGLGLIAVPLLLSLTLHEFGHARTAQAFGDHTARLMGRCSLNPLVHLDLVGTICFLFGPIGWAKPVPVDTSRLRPARWGDIAVSLAGVGMNLGLAAVAVGGLYLMAFLGVQVNPNPDTPPTAGGIAAFMLSYTLIINLSLLFFNIIPLYPLDGHHVVRELLPWRQRGGFMAWQGRIGRYVLFGLILAPWLLDMLKAPVYFNPIAWYMRHVIGPVMRSAVAGGAEILVADAMDRYGVYLLWR